MGCQSEVYNKRCPCCGETKTSDAFSRSSKSRDGRSCYCKSCQSESGKRKAKKNIANYIPYTAEELATRTKLCPACEQQKAYGEFYTNKRRKDGLSCYCISCSRIKGKEARRRWRENNPDRIAAFNKRRRQESLEKPGRHWKEYGIDFTPQEYGERLKLQGDRCCICERPASDFKKRLCVDHSHTTGLVRGIVCSYCNTIIGVIEDRQDLVTKIEDYLEAWNGMPV